MPPSSKLLEFDENVANKYRKLQIMTLQIKILPIYVYVIGYHLFNPLPHNATF